MQLLENNFDFTGSTGSSDPAYDTQNQMDQPGSQIQRNITNTLSSMSIIDNLDKSLDDVFKDVIKNGSNIRTLNDQVQRFEIEDLSSSINMAKKKYGGTNTRNIPKEDLQTRDLLNSNANNMFENVGKLSNLSISAERKNRYEVYKEIPDSNWIAGNMYDVFIQNIFVKNLQSKEFLFINEDDKKLKVADINKDKNNYVSLIKTFQTYFEYEKKLQNFIVPKALTYGNYFMEVINLKKLEHYLNTNTLLLENEEFAKKINTKYNEKDLKIFNECFTFSTHSFLKKDMENGILLENSIINENITDTENQEIKENDFVKKLKSFLIENKPTSLIEERSIFSFLDDIEIENQKPSISDYKFEDIKEINLESLKEIQLKGIDPENVIIIENESILYGYLIIEGKKAGTDNSEINIYQRFLSDGDKTKKNGNEDTSEIVEKLSKYIIDNVTELIRLGKNKGGFKFDDLKLPQDSLSSIKTIIYNKIKEKSKIDFRFVSSNNLVNFSAPINKFAPYGTSIFDPIVQPIKLYNLALISSIISRLSRASVVRKWNVEAGSKRNHAEIIETVKKDIKNKAISFDNLSNIKNISNVLTDFRDIATIKIDGQSFIDMEIVPMSDRALPLNDLTDLKNDLIAASGIPAVYLNITENTELREHLVNVNTNFAQKILLWQNNIEEGLDRLNNIIFVELLQNNNKSNNTFNISTYFKMKLIAPLILQVQSNEALISSITNILGLFKAAEFVVDPKLLYKKYIPNMDWDELEKSGQEFINAKAKTALVDQNQNMM
jgi:hypothetical protein